jgi:hypothetical protein
MSKILPAGSPDPVASVPAVHGLARWSEAIVRVAGGCGLGLLALLAMARFAHAQAATPAWWQAWFWAVALSVPNLVQTLLMAWRARGEQSGEAGRPMRLVPLVPLVPLVRPLLLLVGIIPLHAFSVLWQLRLAVVAFGGVLVCTVSWFVWVRASGLCAGVQQDAPSRKAPRGALGTAQAFMLGGLVLSALMPPAAAPVAARIAIVALLVALVLQAWVWMRESAAIVPPTNPIDWAQRQAAMRRTVVRLTVFVLAYTAPFVLMGISLTLSPLAAGCAALGLVTEAWLALAGIDWQPSAAAV